MMIFRSVVVGLLGAIALLLAGQGAALERVAEQSGRAAGREVVIADEWRWPRAPQVVVHVSWRGAGDDPSDALGLGPLEPPFAIDGALIEGPWRTAVRDRWRATGPGGWFELWVRGPDRLRRMLVLVTS